jgi:hypothetical protein
LAETLLLGEELSTAGSSSNLLALGSSASLGFLDLLQRRTLRQVIGLLGPRCDRGRSSIDRSLSLRTRTSGERLGNVLTVTLGSGCGERRGRGRGREGLGHSMVNLPDRLRGCVALLLLLLLALSGGSLVDLLGQSQGLGTGNRVRQLLSCLLHLGGNVGFVLLRSSGRVGRQALGGAHTHLAFLGTKCMELAETFLAGLLVKWIILMSFIEIILLLLELGTILEHLSNLLGLQEVIRLTASK